MNDEEVDKIIAKYMDRVLVKKGYYWFLTDCMGEFVSPYTKSLDALVPVWEKLNTYPMVDEDEKYLIELLTEERFIDINYVWSKKDTLQEAAAYATAKAILELSK
jgi:hypothetical protein